MIKSQYLLLLTLLWGIPASLVPMRVLSMKGQVRLLPKGLIATRVVALVGLDLEMDVHMLS